MSAVTVWLSSTVRFVIFNCDDKASTRRFSVSSLACTASSRTACKSGAKPFTGQRHLSNNCCTSLTRFAERDTSAVKPVDERRRHPAARLTQILRPTRSRQPKSRYSLPLPSLSSSSLSPSVAGGRPFFDLPPCSMMFQTTFSSVSFFPQALA